MNWSLSLLLAWAIVATIAAAFFGFCVYILVENQAEYAKRILRTVRMNLTEEDRIYVDSIIDKWEES